MKRRVLSLVLLCMITMLIGCQKEGKKVVLQIDDISVSEAEFEMAMSENRTDVILYFGENYGESQFDETFWTKAYGKNNEKPIDVLKQKAVDEITSNLAVLLSAKEAGIISSVSYEDILEMYTQENGARKESVDKGEVIYGVTTFEFRDYYDWLISNCKMQLRNQLSEKVTEQEIRESRNPNFQTESIHLALISDAYSSSEQLTYELRGTIAGESFAIFIDAHTGEELRIVHH